MSAPSAGPWSVRELPENVGGCREILGGDGDAVAVTVGRPDDDEDQANARLLASVWWMRHVLHAAHAALMSYACGNSSIDLAEEVGEAIRAVVAHVDAGEVRPLARITLESTDDVVASPPPARVWRGRTEDGTAVVAFITIGAARSGAARTDARLKKALETRITSSALITIPEGGA